MDQIAELAPVSKRTLYKHFSGKIALFDAMVDKMRAGFRSAFSVIYTRGIPIEDQLNALAVAEGRLFVSQDFMQLTSLLMHEVQRDPELRARFPENGADEAQLRAFFEAATVDGVLAVADSHVAAAQFKSLLKDRPFWQVIYGAPILSEAEMKLVAEEAIATFLSRFGVGS